MTNPTSKKPQIYWAIKGSYGVLPSTCRTTRKKAIADECVSYGEDWEQLKSYGLKCIKVSIQVVIL